MGLWSRGFLGSIVLLIEVRAAIGNQHEVQTKTEEEYSWGELLTVAQMRVMHSQMDTDGDGLVSVPEILRYSLLMRRRIARSDVPVLLEEIDTSGDGKLGLAEVLRDLEISEPSIDEDDMAAQLAKKEDRRRLEMAKFQAADINDDGLLDAEELPVFFYPEVDSQVMAVIVQASIGDKDKDGDGQLSLEEFWEGDLPQVAVPGSTISEVDRVDFAELDWDRNGSLDANELAMWESGLFHTERALKEVFQIADYDRDGLVSINDLEATKEEIAGSDAQYHFTSWARHVEL